ncbi:MAG TPA: GlsB/YeaQ/YmgE family stress response membrane protein [Terriglobia bacterium]|nr:GlsB/YeaQ/YmgE family stress response membrane protein [Terriglobia bacterium]
MIWMIVVGLLVGAVAKLLMPGRDPGGFVITILIGIAGSIVAGFVGRFAGWYAEGEPAGTIASILGAILLLFLYRFLTGQGKSGGLKKAA